jgi:uncharacterized membrane protein
MITVQKSILINRPREEVFNFISNFENDSKWRIDKIEMKKDESKTSLKEIRNYSVRFMNWTVSVPTKITEYNRNKRVAFQSTNNQLILNGFRHVVSLKNNTKLTYSLSAEFKGMFKFLSAFIKRIYAARVTRELEKLKNVLENQSKI